MPKDNAVTLLLATLEHPAARRKVLEEVTGLTPTEIANALETLVEEGMAVRTEAGHRVPKKIAPNESRHQPGLTPVQRRADIVEWIEEGQIAPSMRTMARCYGVGHPVVQNDIRILERAGVVTRDPDRVRGHDLVLTGNPYSDPTEALPSSHRVRATRLIQSRRGASDEVLPVRRQETTDDERD